MIKKVLCGCMRFAFKMFKILVLLTVFWNIYCKDTVPVFIIDQMNVIGNDVVSNPLEAMTKGHFHKLLSKVREHSEKIIIFVEDKFCQEDIIIKDDMGTPFHHLRKGITKAEIKYIPAVYHPYEVFEKIFPHLPSNSYHVASMDFNPEIIAHNNLTYIFFKDEKHETRSNVLRKHDVLMREIYFSLSHNSKKPVVAFYTGKENPIIIDKIHYETNFYRNKNADDSGITVKSKRALFHFKGMEKSIGGRRTLLNKGPMFVKEIDAKNSLKTKISYPEFDLHFDIDYDSRYWTLRRVFCMVDNIMVVNRIIDMPIPWGKSYVCGETLFINCRRGGEMLTIPHMQVQPFIDDKAVERQGSSSTQSSSSSSTEGSSSSSTEGSSSSSTEGSNYKPQEFSFGAAEECTGYFTQNILTCLFVACLLLFVLYNGLQMLMAIGTNDRFDDFKKQYSFGSTRAD